MASWQKRARLGVAVFGLVFGGIVYFAIGERQSVAPPQPVRRVDPKAIIETYAAVLQQVSGGETNYEIEAERQQGYEDGSWRLFGVRITVRNRSGRDYVITAKEAYSGKGEIELRLTGDVKLVASDGFELTTGEATFDQNTGIARASGAVAFRKGRMSGTGVGMIYDQPNDVLRFDASSRIVTTDDTGKTTYDFSAGVATLDRIQHLLTLENTVHVVRGGEVIDADRALARLSENDDLVTFVELRGNARVSGGTGPIDAMSGRALDLDYTDDGLTLERVVLTGEAVIAMTASGNATGRRMLGDSLDLRFAADGSLTRAEGHTNVRLELPAADAGPARSISSDAFEGTGEPGKGLTAATFTSTGCGPGASREACVEYTEQGTGAAGTRTARSRRLDIRLANDSVTSATFSGIASFEEQGLMASAAEAVYAPKDGTLRLTGRDAGGRPRVEEEQVTIDAETIEVGLAARHMTAKGAVRTMLRGDAPGAASARRSQHGPRSRMPGLLEEDEVVHVNADALDYQGSGGSAVYTGNVVLSQGTTTIIRGDTITLDRETGDLVATGNAVSQLRLDAGPSIGRAHEIRYEDRARTINYSVRPLAPTSVRGSATGNVQLNGPDGDVTAQRIDVVLAEDRPHVERLEAYTNVSVTIDTRRATGARLTLHTADARYVMESAPGVPVRLTDRSRNSCTQTTGRTLTFFKGTDTMTVDRAQTKTDGPCGPPPSSR